MSADCPTVLVIDDEENVVNAIRRSLRGEDFAVQTSTNPLEALTLAKKIRPDAVLCDMRMPEMDGAQVLTRLRESNPDCARILLTGYADMRSTIAAINEGQIDRYLSKPWNDDELRSILRHHIELAKLRYERDDLAVSLAFKVDELEQLNQELDQRVAARTQELYQINLFLEQANSELRTQFLNAVKVFSNLIEMSSPAMAGHGRRVAELARSLGHELGLDSQELQDLYVAGLLHDIGKIGMSEKAMTMPYAQLDGENRKVIAQHCERGQLALSALPPLSNVATYVAQHHERLDGKGFPNQLTGEEISRGGRILAVAESWDELHMGLLTNEKLELGQALVFMQAGRGNRFDPLVIDALPGALKRLESTPRENETLVDSNKLIPGQALTRDLFNPEGLLLMPKGGHVTTRLIQYLVTLHQKGHPAFKVYCEKRPAARGS